MREEKVDDNADYVKEDLSSEPAHNNEFDSYDLVEEDKVRVANTMINYPIL